MGTGAIVASVLNEVQFRDEYGPEWVLADGRDASGSRFHTLTGAKQVPDLRGRFLRGAGSGDLGTGGGQDSVTLAVANMPPHEHSIATRVGDASAKGYAPNPPNGNASNNWSWQGSTTGSAGGGEAVPTVPRYWAINYFIRIS